MASAAASENCFLDQMCDDLNTADDFSNIDSSFLMSLLNDSQGEDEDDEMLRAVILSLEPEITNHVSCSGTDNSEDNGFSDECCSTSHDHYPDFEWIGMEMEMEMTGYFTGNMVEVGGLEEDYSQVCYEMAMEEDEDDYIDLWQ